MAKKPTKADTAMAHAKSLYMADRCNGAVSVMKDHDIIDCRVRAFVDGARWQQRQKVKNGR
jgi:hypothetical protein